MSRTFVDAPDAVRCRAQIKPLSDGTTARCGRHIDQPHCAVCKQHRRMFREGKSLIDHVTGQPLTSVILYQEGK